MRTKKYCEFCGEELVYKLVPAKAVDKGFPRFALDSGEKIYFDSYICPNYVEDGSHTRVASIEMTNDGKLSYKRK